MNALRKRDGCDIVRGACQRDKREEIHKQEPLSDLPDAQYGKTRDAAGDPCPAKGALLQGLGGFDAF